MHGIGSRYWSRLSTATADGTNAKSPSQNRLEKEEEKTT